MYQCPNCGKQFGSAETLSQHVARIHTSARRRKAESVHPALRFVMKVCAFFFAIGLLALVIATASELFGSNETYPGFGTNEDGSLKQVGYWTYLWQIGIVVVVTGAVGFRIWLRAGSPEPEEW